MNINSAYPSKYLKADDIGDEDLVLTIKTVTIEDVGSSKKEEKPVVHFDEVEKGLVLNVTNKNAIVELYGAETDDWPGNKIALFQTEVDFQGDQVMSIRVRKRKPAGVKTSPQPANGKNAAPTGPPQRPVAWKKFCSLTTNMDGAGRNAAWFAALDQFFGHHDQHNIAGDDWKSFADGLNSWNPTTGFPHGLRTQPKAENPLSDVPEFADSEIPY